MLILHLCWIFLLVVPCNICTCCITPTKSEIFGCTEDKKIIRELGRVYLCVLI